jgi:hypothetical protein
MPKASLEEVAKKAEPGSKRNAFAPIRCLSSGCGQSRCRQRRGVKKANPGSIALASEPDFCIQDVSRAGIKRLLGVDCRRQFTKFVMDGAFSSLVHRSKSHEKAKCCPRNPRFRTRGRVAFHGNSKKCDFRFCRKVAFFFLLPLMA